MRLIFGLLLSLSVFTVSATPSVSVTVELPIDQTHRLQLIENAKAKAVHQAMDRLPSVVWGEQTLKGDFFSEHIKAVGFVNADVEILTENYDNKNNLFVMTANVRWNEDKIMSTLHQVKQGQDAKRTLGQIEKIINGMDVRDFLSSAGRNKLEEARLLASPFHMGMDLTRYYAQYNTVLAQMLSLRKERMIDYIQLLKITPKGIINKVMIYEIEFPPFSLIEPHFESEDLQAFYESNNEVITQAIKLCFMAPHAKLFPQKPRSTNSRQPILSDELLTKINTAETTTLTLEAEPVDLLLNGRIKPIYFHPCSHKGKP
ncbi:hypothetical protein [Rheinheimera sp.]|uniref:hypothetical protein n=1 Tax=Rheinheimera sp. TaxID=1869214 RepID=UPI004047548D